MASLEHQLLGHSKSPMKVEAKQEKNDEKVLDKDLSSDADEDLAEDSGLEPKQEKSLIVSTTSQLLFFIYVSFKMMTILRTMCVKNARRCWILRSLLQFNHRTK